MNSSNTEIVLFIPAFLKSISNTRLAKAKIHFKTDSSYEATNLQFVWTYQASLDDTKVIVYCSWGILGRILVIMPEQNQSCDRSLIWTPSQIRDKINMHSGNLGKHISSGYAIEILSGDIYFSKKVGNNDTVTIPLSFKPSWQGFKSLSGGKIVDQAKVFGNSKNMLNSIWLNNANQCPVYIQRRSFSTDLTDRNNLLFVGDQWKNIQ
jgi:hypothetical protein